MASTEELNIVLPSELVRTIRDKVSTGAFACDSDVIRDALRIWQDHENDRAERLASIRFKIERSLADPRPELTREMVTARLRTLRSDLPARCSAADNDAP